MEGFYSSFSWQESANPSVALRPVPVSLCRVRGIEPMGLQIHCFCFGGYLPYWAHQHTTTIWFYLLYNDEMSEVRTAGLMLMMVCLCTHCIIVISDLSQLDNISLKILNHKLCGSSNTKSGEHPDNWLLYLCYPIGVTMCLLNMLKSLCVDLTYIWFSGSSSSTVRSQWPGHNEGLFSSWLV